MGTATEKARRRAQRADPTAHSKAKYGKANRYVGLPWAMVRSHTFRSLSGATLKYFIELHSRYHGKNNGQISVSCDEAATLLGMSKSTAMRAQRDLVDKGFIVRTRAGSWRGRLAAEWAMTHRPIDHPKNGWVKSPNCWEDWRPGRKFLGILMEPSRYSDETSSVPSPNQAPAMVPPEYRYEASNDPPSVLSRNTSIIPVDRDETPAPVGEHQALIEGLKTGRQNFGGPEQNELQQAIAAGRFSKEDLDDILSGRGTA